MHACMHAVVSHYQNAGQNQYILVANKSFENVADFKYLGTKITNPNFIYKKFRVNSIFGMLAIILFKVSKHINTKT